MSAPLHPCNVGDWVIRREVLPAGCWLGTWAKIIEHTPDALVSFIPEGSPFGFPEGDWPIPGGRHPWWSRPAWQGHGCLMWQPKDQPYAVWYFWQGAERNFDRWYINLQEPYRFSPYGYDTLDLELDYEVFTDGTWVVKDDELLDQRAEEGRWSWQRVEEIRAIGATIAKRLQAGERWWPSQWQHWQPTPGWQAPASFPDGWHLTDA